MDVVITKTGIVDINMALSILDNDGYSNTFTWSDFPGTTYGWHTHNNDEIRWVIKGEIVIGYDDESIHLFPGDRIDIKGGTRHWAKTDEGVSYVCASI